MAKPKISMPNMPTATAVPPTAGEPQFGFNPMGRDEAPDNRKAILADYRLAMNVTDAKGNTTNHIDKMSDSTLWRTIRQVEGEGEQAEQDRIAFCSLGMRQPTRRTRTRLMLLALTMPRTVPSLSLRLSRLTRPQWPILRRVMMLTRW